MKVVYSGGLNKYKPDGFGKSYLYEYSTTVKKLIETGKGVCFVTLAKPDHYYDEHIVPQFGDSVDIIGRKTNDDINWRQYDLVFLCGGDQLKLKEELLKKRFNIKNLRKHVVVLGDSAGAVIMAPYFYYYSDDMVNVKFKKGLYPKSGVIVAVHTNNPRYFNKVMRERIEKFAKKHSLGVLELEENETKLFDEKIGEFVNFDFRDLF